MSELLRVQGLKKYFPVYGGVLWRQVASVAAVDGIDLTIKEGETLGLVGESGCGKSTFGHTMLRLMDASAGDIYFQKRKITNLSERAMRPLRKDMQIIFQDPYESLNARHSVRAIIEEPLIIHGWRDEKKRRAEVLRLLERVGLSASALDRYPHEFSGGQRQRIGIARAIALKPKLIVCDEPVSALDVSIQSQILNLLLELQAEMGLAYLFIAHDLAVVKHISHRVAVMYLGKIVEIASAEAIYQETLHPYTKALMSAIPLADPAAKKNKQEIILSGDVPSPQNPPSGCRFHTRCPFVQEKCRAEEPLLRFCQKSTDPEHLVACHFAEDL